jgi:hypothetical protein
MVVGGRDLLRALGIARTATAALVARIAGRRFGPSPA